MTPTDEGAQTPMGGQPAAFDELVRAATRLAMGSAGVAVASVTRRHRGSDDDPSTGASAAGTVTSAALGLGLAAERAVVRGASIVGGTAASVTWGVMRAGPFRRPVERLAEWFRGEQRLSEQEAAEVAGEILDALGEAVLTRIDIDHLIDRIALERVLARMDRRELLRRVEQDGTDQEVTG